MWTEAMWNSGASVVVEALVLLSSPVGFPDHLPLSVLTAQPLADCRFPSTIPPVETPNIYLHRVFPAPGMTPFPTATNLATPLSSEQYTLGGSTRLFTTTTASTTTSF